MEARLRRLIAVRWTQDVADIGLDRCTEGLGARIDLAPEGVFGTIEIRSHPEVLGTLARKQESNSRRLTRAAAHDARAAARLQSGRRLERRPGHDDTPVFELLAADREREARVGKPRKVVRRQRSGKPIRQDIERGFRARGDGQHVPLARRS